MNYKAVEKINTKRLALINEMTILALKVSPVMGIEEMAVIQTEIDLVRDELNALPTLEDAAHGKKLVHHYLCTVTFKDGYRTFDLKVEDPDDDKVRAMAIERAISNSQLNGPPQTKDNVVSVKYRETGYLIY
ncbi:hypothetical protein ASD24_24465 [Paenibacillus sp. Root52]|uniref:hypothetical protein n=1 Tax=Paenibacillus sp. Root52 TaxID=1736552 RepID=UPI0006FE7565|nr:hypothetical protein [Paenibacillus sp. Root52]KQY90954.1 hypothetical protein ASD24_24465 [Paenibacillus sp. Root52]